MNQNYDKFLVEDSRFNPPIDTGSFKTGAKISQKRFKLMLFVLITLVIATFKLFYDLTRIDTINTKYNLEVSHQTAASQYLKLKTKSEMISTEIKEGQLQSFIKLSPFDLMEYAIDKNKAISRFCPSSNDQLLFKFPVSHWRLFLYSSLKTESIIFKCKINT